MTPAYTDVTFLCIMTSKTVMKGELFIGLAHVATLNYVRQSVSSSFPGLLSRTKTNTHVVLLHWCYVYVTNFMSQPFGVDLTRRKLLTIMLAATRGGDHCFKFTG